MEVMPIHEKVSRSCLQQNKAGILPITGLFFSHNEGVTIMAQQKRTRWSDTQAARNAAAEAENRQTQKNYIKIESLEEVAFTIVNVAFTPSDFEGTDEQVEISLTLDGDDNTEDEGTVYTLTTTRSSIMRRMRDVSTKDLPIGPVTIYETGRDRRYGTVYYSIGETVPDIDSSPIKDDGHYTPSGHVARDVSEDRKRQSLAHASPGKSKTR